MAGYDILMIAVLAGTTLWGAFKGAAWQLAALAALIVSYFASYYLSDSLTSTGLFGDTAPWNRFAAMLTIYIITGIIIWMGFRVIAETIERIKLRDFDRQLGALFGLLKGIIFCLLITFFVVTLLPGSQEQVINTRSGRYIARLLHSADTIMPPELHTLLEPYIKRFEENLQPTNFVGSAATMQNSPSANPQPWSAGMSNLPNWGNTGNPGTPNSQVPNPGNYPGYSNPPNYNQPTSSQPPAHTYPSQNPDYGYPNQIPQNPYDGAGGQPAYSSPPLPSIYPQQSPYPQSYTPTPPAIDPPRYGEPGYQGGGYQPTGYYPPQPPAQSTPFWGAQLPPADAWNR